jgi:hypothetical protein
MFFEHEEIIVPISQIKHCSTDGAVTTITLLDGQVLESKGFYTAERLAAMAAPFVQAQAGYFKIAEPDRGTIIDDSWPVVPIVAWRIVGDLHLAEPITPEMVSEVRCTLPRWARLQSEWRQVIRLLRRIHESEDSRPLSSRPDEAEATDSKLYIIQNQGALQ